MQDEVRPVARHPSSLMIKFNSASVQDTKIGPRISQFSWDLPLAAASLSSGDVFKQPRTTPEGVYHRLSRCCGTSPSFSSAHTRDEISDEELPE